MAGIQQRKLNTQEEKMCPNPKRKNILYLGDTEIQVMKKSVRDFKITLLKIFKEISEIFGRELKKIKSNKLPNFYN